MLTPSTGYQASFVQSQVNMEASPCFPSAPAAFDVSSPSSMLSTSQSSGNMTTISNLQDQAMRGPSSCYGSGCPSPDSFSSDSHTSQASSTATVAPSSRQQQEFAGLPTCMEVPWHHEANKAIEGLGPDAIPQLEQELLQALGGQSAAPPSAAAAAAFATPATHPVSSSTPDRVLAQQQMHHHQQQQQQQHMLAHPAMRMHSSIASCSVQPLTIPPAPVVSSHLHASMTSPNAAASPMSAPQILPHPSTTVQKPTSSPIQPGFPAHRKSLTMYPQHHHHHHQQQQQQHQQQHQHHHQLHSVVTPTLPHHYANAGHQLPPMAVAHAHTSLSPPISEYDLSEQIALTRTLVQTPILQPSHMVTTPSSFGGAGLDFSPDGLAMGTEHSYMSATLAARMSPHALSISQSGHCLRFPSIASSTGSSMYGSRLATPVDGGEHMSNQLNAHLQHPDVFDTFNDITSSDGGSRYSNSDGIAQSLPPTPPPQQSRPGSGGAKKASRRGTRRNQVVKNVVLRGQLVNPKHRGPPPASLQLWEFLLHHLELRIALDAVAWIDETSGKFRIVNSEKIARMWGDYRAVPAMDYEKMTRALRYYYKRCILDKLQRRLIYQFSGDVMKQIIAFRARTAAKE